MNQEKLLRILLAGGGIFLISLALGGIIWLNRTAQTNLNIPSRLSPSVSPSPQPSLLPINPTVSPETTISPLVPDNWQTYESGPSGYSFSHPPELQPEIRQDGSVILTQWGPTQKANTEFYDGLSLSFTPGLYSGTFSDFVQSEANSLASEPIVDSVTSLRSVSIASVSGWQFQVESMGTRTNLYLPFGTGRYLKVTNATQDPTGQGYLLVADQVIQSIHFSTN